MLIFVEEGKPENPEKNPRSNDENQQQTQPTCDAGSGNRTRATAVGGQAPVVQRLDNAIHRINHYPADSVVCFVNTYPLDSDLSAG